MTPTLPDVLRRLAEAVPGRLRLREVPRQGYTVTYYSVHVDGAWQGVGFTDTADGLYQPGQECVERLWLEAALREEIEARGWEWSTGTIKATAIRPHEPWATINGGSVIYADTPALALACALLEALGGERGAS